MATSTVLRVKRRLEDNPHDALVLMCKRIKTDTDEISPSLFVFRGTVENQETPNVKSIVPKTDLKLKSTSKVEDIIQKLRNERKEQTAESRYEVVKFSRGLKDSDTEEFDLVDLQRTHDEEGDVQYAYDLYLAAAKGFDVSMLDQLVRIENYESDLVLNQNGAGSSSDEAEDDDDSNDENNWRNEYPDSEASSIDEDVITKAMERVAVEDDLSSDEGEDQIYTDELSFKEDAKRYGEAYAKYKAKVLSEDANITESSFVHCATIKEMDEESVEGYKEDSDQEGFYYGQDEDTDQFREQYASDEEYSPD